MKVDIAKKLDDATKDRPETVHIALMTEIDIRREIEHARDQRHHKLGLSVDFFRFDLTRYPEVIEAIIESLTADGHEVAAYDLRGSLAPFLLRITIDGQSSASLVASWPATSDRASS